MTTKSLFLVLMSTSTALSYVSTSTPSGIITKPTFGSIHQHEEEDSTLRVPTNQHRHSTTYDLGLGKNPPVVGKRTSIDTDRNTATRFWVEHEAVHQYPSPSLAIEEFKPRIPPKMPLPKVKPSRMSEDVLNISSKKGSSVIFQANPNLKIDLNTVWVEMMIHNQQMQLATN